MIKRQLLISCSIVSKVLIPSSNLNTFVVGLTFNNMLFFYFLCLEKKLYVRYCQGPLHIYSFVVLKNRPEASKVMIGITPSGFDKEMPVDGVR